LRSIALFFLPFFVLVTGPVLVLASAPVPGDGPLLVITRWGAHAERIIGAAGGHVYGPARAPFGTLATSDNPAFADNLRAAGAWAVIDGSHVAGLCGALK